MDAHIVNTQMHKVYMAWKCMCVCGQAELWNVHEMVIRLQAKEKITNRPTGSWKERAIVQQATSSIIIMHDIMVACS